MINKDTSLSGYFEGSWKDLVDQFISANRTYHDNDKVIDLAKLYIKFGKIFAIRADLVWAQMCHETDFLEYKSVAKPEWNNFASIGVIGKEGIGNRFETIELGVIAHYAHLAWYITPRHVNEYCNKTYDPRHFGLRHRYNGNHSLERLNGTGAVPGTTYAQRIAEIANGIAGSERPKVEKYDLIIQMGHVGRIRGYVGTRGEQAFNKVLGPKLFKKFENSNVKVRLMGADNFYLPEPNKTKLFFSIHADGSRFSSSRGISVGYPVPSNPVFAQSIKEAYIRLTGFSAKRDNYTKGLERYYAWRWDDREIPHTSADYYCLLEHGFMTNQIERDYMNNHTGEIADCHYDTIAKFIRENY